MRKIGVCEFIDNESFSNLESLIVQLGVKECILEESSSATNHDLKKIEVILNRSNVVLTFIKKVDFQTKDLEQDVKRLVKEKVLNIALFELKTAMSSVAALIKYLSLMADSSNFGLFSIFLFDLTQYMRLDATAVRALNLLPQGTEASNKNMSIFGLLNNCKTTQGSRMLMQWLKQPLMQVPLIDMRLNVVQVLTEDLDLRTTLQDNILKSFPDLNRLAKKFQKNSASLQDVVRAYQVSLKLPELLEALEQYDGEYKWIFEECYTTKLTAYITKLAKFQNLVQSTIDLDEIDNHEYLIKADFDDALQETKAKMEEVFDDINKEATNVSVGLDMDLDKKLKFEKNSTHGYHLRVSRIDSAKLRHVKALNIIELSTQKSGVLFTTKNMKELNIEHEDLTEKYNQLQNDLVSEVIKITASYFSVFEPLNEMIAHLDILVSFAHVSIHSIAKYTRPTFLTERKVILKGSRHPCLEMQDEISFISNDVDMIKGGSSFQIITGPNMGGKSTYIRQIGVISLMAQIGCFVPCDSAELCVFDSILARVGAGDSQLKGVSTFMAEMLETASILKSATVNSLIIIDELGRGTSTHDGFGLAWSIAEHIATKIDCFCLFATHFHELTTLDEKVSSVLNRHVKVHASESDITLLYKVNDGICDQSFGIHVASLAKFPNSVVRLAKRKADELEASQEDKENDDEQGMEIEASNPSKFSKLDELNGNMLVTKFLSEFRSLENVESMTVEELRDSLDSLKEKYTQDFNQNPYVKEILSSF